MVSLSCHGIGRAVILDAGAALVCQCVVVSAIVAVILIAIVIVTTPRTLDNKSFE